MAKTVVQLSATIGRQFIYELLQAVSPLDEATLRHSLAQLVEANCSCSEECRRRRRISSSMPSSRTPLISRS